MNPSEQFRKESAFERGHIEFAPLPYVPPGLLPSPERSLAGFHARLARADEARRSALDALDRLRSDLDAARDGQRTRELIDLLDVFERRVIEIADMLN